MRSVLYPTFLAMLLASSVHAEFPVSFGDPRLKEVVEDELWILDPTPTDMLALTSLTADSRGITSLAGLEHAANLTLLEMTHNQISDLSPLAGLSNLSVVILNTNNVSDLIPLGGLQNLRELNIHANRISDVSPLSGLPNLRTLILRVNQISDVSSLGNLPELTELNLEDNQITSLSGLGGLNKLMELRLGFNQISDLTPICGLSNLSYLDVHNNQVSDISCLTGSTALSRLDLRNNPLNQAAYDEDIPRIVTNNPGIYIEHDSHAGHILFVSSTAGGSVIEPGEGKLTYDYDAYIRLTAQADPGFEFVGWSGSFSGSQNPLLITLSADAWIQATFVSVRTELYIDDDAPGDPGPDNPQISDPHEDGSFEHPFDRIQEALDVATNGVSIIVGPGTYRENIDLLGKKVHVTAVDPQRPQAGPSAVVEGTGNGPVIRIPPGGGVECSLVGFVITKGKGQPAGAVHCTGSSPTLANCLITGNRCLDPNGAAVLFQDSRAVLTNCTIADNYAGAGLILIDSSITITDSIIWGNAPEEIRNTGNGKPVIRYCAVRGWWPDIGNIHADPLFVRPGAWVNGEDSSVVVAPSDPRAVWADGDYHLKSRAGRWDPAAGLWLRDNVTSPAIDAGDPTGDVGYEPSPNGGRVNMGAYGGTSDAAKSPPAPDSP